MPITTACHCQLRVCAHFTCNSTRIFLHRVLLPAASNSKQSYQRMFQCRIRLEQFPFFLSDLDGFGHGSRLGAVSGCCRFIVVNMDSLFFSLPFFTFVSPFCNEHAHYPTTVFSYPSFSLARMGFDSVRWRPLGKPDDRS